MVNPTDENAKMQAAVDREEKAAQKQATALNSNSKSIFKNTLETAKSTAAMVGMTQIVGGLATMLAKSVANNEQLSKNLVQATTAQTRSTDVMKGFAGSMVGMQQALDTFSDSVMLGMSRFSEGALKFSAQLKAQGIDNKGVMMLMRRNVQAFGLGEEATLMLADSLVSTAVANADSVDGLISAINSMKEALTKTAVELGPEAAANAEKIAAMMAQNNTELQTAASKFVTSFLAGSEGFMKAVSVAGVVFTGQESLPEMVAKFEQILTSIGERQAGMQGPGSQFFFDSMERSFKLTREDFLLQQQIGNSINALVEGNTNERQERLSEISVTQAWQNATFKIQERMLVIMEGVAKAISFVGDQAAGYMIPILAGLGPMLLTLVSVTRVGFQGLTLLFGSLPGALAGLFGGTAGAAAGGGPVGIGTGALIAGVVHKTLGSIAKNRLISGASLALMGSGIGTKAGLLLKGLQVAAAAGTAFFAVKKMNEAVEGARAAVGEAFGPADENLAKLLEEMNKTMKDLSEQEEDVEKLQQEQLELARRRTRIVEAQFTGDRGAGPLMEISRFLIQNLAAQQQIIELTEAGNADRISLRPGTATSTGFNF
jgi:hypothetical protein